MGYTSKKNQVWFYGNQDNKEPYRSLAQSIWSSAMRSCLATETSIRQNFKTKAQKQTCEMNNAWVVEKAVQIHTVEEKPDFQGFFEPTKQLYGLSAPGSISVNPN